jgi:hypothetical protein
MSTETDLLILEVPVLEDEAVAALQDFLWDLLTQFESHYFMQLQRHHRKLDAIDRDPLEPWKRLTPDAADPEVDEDFNDELPF